LTCSCKVTSTGCSKSTIKKCYHFWLFFWAQKVFSSLDKLKIEPL